MLKIDSFLVWNQVFAATPPYDGTLAGYVSSNFSTAISHDSFSFQYWH